MSATTPTNKFPGAWLSCNPSRAWQLFFIVQEASRNFLHLVAVRLDRSLSLTEACLSVRVPSRNVPSELRADIVDYGHGFPVWPVRVPTTRAWLNTAEEFWWTAQEKVSAAPVATFTLLNCVSRPILRPRPVTTTRRHVTDDVRVKKTARNFFRSNDTIALPPRNSSVPFGFGARRARSMDEAFESKESAEEIVPRENQLFYFRVFVFPFFPLIPDLLSCRLFTLRKRYFSSFFMFRDIVSLLFPPSRRFFFFFFTFYLQINCKRLLCAEHVINKFTFLSHGISR